jgi:hypothetical protein
VSSTTRRRAPLAADPLDASLSGDASPERADVEIVHTTVGDLEHDRAERDERFLAGIRTLRVGGARLRLEERILMVAGGVIAPLGVIVVLLGWWGASHTPYVFEQVPYLISGGLLGLGMVFLGAFFYFTHWVTQLVKEQRAQSAAVLEALHHLADEVSTLRGGALPHAATGQANGVAPAVRPLELVATERGTMAHRRECVVVAGKPGLRPVAASEGLAACKLCEPYAPALA